MNRRAVAFLIFSPLWPQERNSTNPSPAPGPEEKVRLPSGRLQEDEIVKADHLKTLAEARQLAKLSADLAAELEKSEPWVVSVASIRKSEEIEKLARRIRGRLKRN